MSLLVARRGSIHRPVVDSGGGGGDEPDSITGLTLWLDASDLTGFAEDDGVDTWPDKSGNGYDATSPPGNQPRYKSAGVGGQPSCDFFESSRYMHQDMDEPQGEWTWFFVIKADTDTSSNLSYLWDQGNPRFIFRHRAETGAGKPDWYDGSSKKSSEDSISGEQVYEFNLSDTGGTIYRDKTSIHTDTYNQRSLSSTSEQRFASGYSGGNPYIGHIAEVIVYNHALGSTDRDTIYAYLADKYGFTF